MAAINHVRFSSSPQKADFRSGIGFELDYRRFVSVAVAFNIYSYRKRRNMACGRLDHNSQGGCITAESLRAQAQSHGSPQPPPL